MVEHMPGTHFNGVFRQFDSAVYGPGGPRADALEALEAHPLKSIDTTAKIYAGDGLRSRIVATAGEIPSDGVREGQGQS
jgi:hypothetical protein